MCLLSQGQLIAFLRQTKTNPHAIQKMHFDNFHQYTLNLKNLTMYEWKNYCTSRYETILILARSFFIQVSNIEFNPTTANRTIFLILVNSQHTFAEKKAENFVRKYPPIQIFRPDNILRNNFRYIGLGNYFS